MNLWILDERLAHHLFLASDLPLRDKEVKALVEVDSDDRPDLLIFDRPFAFADDHAPDYSAIVIIEFKRPARDDYKPKDKKDPIRQVFKYIALLRKGKAKDKHGKPIPVPEQLPIFAYIVCDFTPTLLEQVVMHDLNPTTDGKGFFGYHKTHRAYVEVISFAKLLADAKKRNKVLFDKIGLDGEAGSHVV